jgi:hypothetical protein
VITYEWYLDGELVATGSECPFEDVASRLQLKVTFTDDNRYERDVLPKSRQQHGRPRAARRTRSGRRGDRQ